MYPLHRLLFAALSVAALTVGCSAATPPAPSGAPVSAVAADRVPLGYDATRDAAADIRAGLRQSARDHREVLIDFGADWCPDCQVLGRTFGSAQVRPLLDRNYLEVAVDVGHFDHNLDLAARYVNLETSGIPALVVLRPDGTVRTATNDGAFANARSMTPDQVTAFLTRWAPTGAP